MSRWAAQRPQDFCLDVHIAGAALRPIATQGRSYTKRCVLEMEPKKNRLLKPVFLCPEKTYARFSEKCHTQK